MAFEDSSYTAIIRTDRCDDIVRDMVSHLRAQSVPPDNILFVDSSRSIKCLKELQALGAIVVTYPDEPFNFSKAINIGVDAAERENCLIISSHVILHRSTFIADGLSAARQNNCDVLYWAISPVKGVDGNYVITTENFNGKNGLSNSCALIPTALLRQRRFREEVFSAEDQEWASWYLRQRRGRVMRTVHSGFEYQNPNVNATKKINEEIAIAYYTYRRNLMPDYIAARLLRALLAAVRRRPERARMHWEIVKGLTSAIFKKPVRQSKYF